MRFAVLAALIIPSVFARAVIHRAVAVEEQFAADAAVSSVITPTRDLDGNYLYEVPLDIINSVASDPPAPSVVPELRRLQEKVEISESGIYFSQTNSYAVPDLEVIRSQLPDLRPYPNFPNSNV